MAEYLIQGETLTAVANKLREYLNLTGKTFSEVVANNTDVVKFISDERAIEIIYHEYVDDRLHGYDEGLEGPWPEIIRGWGYLTDYSGEIVPVLYKTDPDAYNAYPDLFEPLYYQGTATINGVVYDKWRKIDSDYTWEETSVICYYTTRVVNTVSASTLLSPLTFPGKIDEVYELGQSSGGSGGGADTSDATATAADILSGKTAYVSTGKVTGTIATKTSSNLSASGSTVTVPAGYYSVQATKNVASATQATPTITVNASGLITATATQTAGYVAAGTKSATKQLAFQAAKTITPTTANQTAVSSGYYTGGAITVKGDANLVASNIKSGVSIFGVAGTYQGSGGDTSIEDAIIEGTLSGAYSNPRVTYIASYAFYNKPVRIAVLENVGQVGTCAFSACYSLTGVSLPTCSALGMSAFAGCASLTTVVIPACQRVMSMAFYQCTNLVSISLQACTNIFPNAFAGCTKLNAITIGTSNCILSNSTAFANTQITPTHGTIRVPSAYVDAYKTASAWYYFSSRIVGV